MREFFATLTKPKTIQLIILVMIIVSILAIIFTLVVILIPNLFPEWLHIRESVLTLATCSMVLGTLILAFGTFSVIMHDREREQRLRKERYVNEILGWLRESDDRLGVPPQLDIYKQIKDDKYLATELKIPIANIESLRQTRIRITNLDIVQKEIRDALYFKKVAFKLNPDFSEIINNILCLLEERIKLITKEAQYPLDTDDDVTKMIKTGAFKLMMDLSENNTKPLDGLNLSEKNINTILMARNAGGLKEFTNKAIEKAIDLKYVI